MGSLTADPSPLPVEDSTIDVIISNCVINLVPNKDKAFKEAFRVLKPGGRLMVSDIVLLKKLPDFVKDSIEAYVGCIAGAATKDRYLGAIKSAGFGCSLEEKREWRRIAPKVYHTGHHRRRQGRRSRRLDRRDET